MATAMIAEMLVFRNIPPRGSHPKAEVTLSPDFFISGSILSITNAFRFSL
jgi:hypothetical protein